MAKELAGISMSHAPGILGWPDAPAEDVRARINAALIELTESLDSAKPDVISRVLGRSLRQPLSQPHARLRGWRGGQAQRSWRALPGNVADRS